MLQLDSLKEELLRSDDAFRSLYEEHREYKQRLADIRQKTLPSEEDEAEIKRIKLHKLQLKDQMEAMLRDHAQMAAATA